LAESGGSSDDWTLSRWVAHKERNRKDPTMPHTTQQLWQFNQDLGTAVNAADLVGYDVEATDGHIGKIDKASTETDRHHLVVDTGFWIFGKKRMVPAGLVSKVDAGDGRLWISMSKDQIKSAPDYDDVERRYSDDDYDREFGGYYQGLP